MATAKKSQIKVTLQFEKSTKGTHVFKDESDNAMIPALYIRKHAFPNGEPSSITVTVDSAS